MNNEDKRPTILRSLIRLLIYTGKVGFNIKKLIEIKQFAIKILT